jgi:hypothetical protein
VRTKLFLVIILLCAGLHARDPEHFSGALELGAGWGHAVDFTLENNHPTFKYLLPRIIAIPWQAGIHVARDLDPDSKVEFGMSYHRRSSDWIYERSFITGSATATSTTHMVLGFDCIDFSLKYYRFLDYWQNRELYAFGGLSPVWILGVPHASDLVQESVPRHCFRSWNLALEGGLALERERFRWKLQLDLCLVSVVNGDYALEIPAKERAWGTTVLPFEVLLCCAYLLR